MSMKDYWIAALANTLEFKELGSTLDIEIAEVLTSIETAIDDEFIATATEKGIARRETILGIYPFPTDTLQTRRERVALNWNNGLPYTYTKLVERIEELVKGAEYYITLDHNNYTLVLTLSLSLLELQTDVLNAINKMIPANIVLSVTLLYNTYNDLANYTYTGLTAFTYEELRSSEAV